MTQANTVPVGFRVFESSVSSTTGDRWYKVATHREVTPWVMKQPEHLRHDVLHGGYDFLEVNGLFFVHEKLFLLLKLAYPEVTKDDVIAK